MAPQFEVHAFSWRSTLYIKFRSLKSLNLEVQNDHMRISALLNSTFQEGYSLDDIYNMDKTSFSTLLDLNQVLLVMYALTKSNSRYN